MRVVGGRFKGRSLAAPRTQAIRPTTDRARESLFNILQHNYPEALEGARVLDLFAGTGALGIEALSRGAASLLCVEESVEARGLLRKNFEDLGLMGTARVYRRDATRLGVAGTHQPFSLLFADPPYNKGLGEKALVSAATGGWLTENALCIVEEDVGATFYMPKGFDLLEERKIGGSIIRFLRIQKDGYAGA